MNNEIEISLVDTLRSSELYELTFDVADALMSPIPIFGSLSKLWGGVQSMHSYFYAKKVLAFLRELGSVPKEERESQITLMLSKAGEQEKFGEHLALLLDRMNDVSKAAMMGKIATAFVRGRISLDDLKSLNFALDKIDPRMEHALKDVGGAMHGSASEEAMMLAQCGLMTPHLAIETTPLDLTTASLDGRPSKTDRYKTFKSAELRYTVNRLGKLFVEVCLN